MNEQCDIKRFPTGTEGLGKCVNKVLLACITVMSTGFGLLAGERPAVESDSTEVHFLQSKSTLDPRLDDNKARLDSLIDIIRDRRDSVDRYRLTNIMVVGSASPEGSVAINRRLSERRALNIFNYIGERVPLDSSLTKFEFLGRDWRGLYRLVAADPRVPYRQSVLDLLSPLAQPDVMTPAQSDRLLAALKKLHGGKPYLYLYTHLFPQLRNSRLFVEYELIAPRPIVVDTVVPPLPVVIEIPDTLTSSVDTPLDEPLLPQATCRPFYMGLKTNRLSDGLLVPNIGAEFYLGKNWSVVGNWTYGWWDRNRSHWYWRGYGGDVALRKWFGAKADAKPLTGHHIGVYAGVLTFDFETGGKGYMGGRPGHSLWDRCLCTAGIEYGYSMPIARRLNLDFTIGIGYIGGKIVKYHPEGNKYVWDSTRKFNAVLPTKLEVSLVWLIGCGNHN